MAIEVKAVDKNRFWQVPQTETKSTANVQNNEKNNKQLPIKIVLGSLAAVGVLGMADILIYKGKHINKLINGTELKEALTRATKAENGLEEMTNRAVTAEDKVNATTRALKESKRALEELERSIPDKIKNAYVTFNRQGMQLINDLYDMRFKYPDKLDKYVLENIDQTFEWLKLEPIYDYRKLPDGLCHFELSSANIKETTITLPALREKETGSVIIKGIAVLPMDAMVRS